jgi:kynurenine formamidase
MTQPAVRYIELSHAINDGMPVFPGLEPPRGSPS